MWWFNGPSVLVYSPSTHPEAESNDHNPGQLQGICGRLFSPKALISSVSHHCHVVRLLPSLTVKHNSQTPYTWFMQTSTRLCCIVLQAGRCISLYFPSFLAMPERKLFVNVHLRNSNWILLLVIKEMTDVDMYSLNENKMLTKPESCGGTTVTSWCKLQTPDESQMLAGVCTKRTVFIVTAWLSQQYVQYKMMKLAFKLSIRWRNKPKSLGI